MNLIPFSQSTSLQFFTIHHSCLLQLCLPSSSAASSHSLYFLLALNQLQHRYRECNGCIMREMHCWIIDIHWNAHMSVWFAGWLQLTFYTFSLCGGLLSASDVFIWIQKNRTEDVSVYNCWNVSNLFSNLQQGKQSLATAESQRVGWIKTWNSASKKNKRVGIDFICLE